MKSTVTEALPSMFSFSTFTKLGSEMFETPGAVDITTEEANRPVWLSVSFEWQATLTSTGACRSSSSASSMSSLVSSTSCRCCRSTVDTRRSQPTERIRSTKEKRYQADVAKALPIAYAVMSLLAFVFISTIYLDIARPIQ
ncbi:MAG: hypothetical protein R2706_04075 [Acidimicrobiales bacterium]